jgi:hypothetical protein
MAARDLLDARPLELDTRHPGLARHGAVALEISETFAGEPVIHLLFANGQGKVK